MTVQVEALTYEALKAKCDHLEQINTQTLQIKLTMAETIKELTDRVNALAVENAALKSAITGKAYVDFVTSNGWNPGMKTINGKFAGFMDAEIDFGCMAYDHAKKLIDAVETPATDAALAAIRDEATARALKHLCDCQLISATVAELKADELREAK